MMEFLHWWAIGIGTVGLAAPVAIHFLTRPKPIPLPLSTVRFLMEVIEQRRARSRLRDWIILLLRTICVALIAMALARPLFSDRPTVNVVDTTDVARVIVIDCSQSMMATNGGISAWSQAQTRALQYLNLSAGAKANVILGTTKPKAVFDAMSTNIAFLRESIEETKPGNHGIQCTSAIDIACEILSKSGSTNQELVIISDFQRSNWGTLRMSQIPSDIKTQFEAVGIDQTANVAITAVRTTSDLFADQTGSMEVEIANYSDHPVEVKCRLAAGELQTTIEGTIPAQSTKVMATDVRFEGAGWRHGWASLVNNLDCLPADDRRPITIEVRSPASILLASRQNANVIPSSSFYLENALQVCFGRQSKSDALNEETTSIQRVHSQRDPFDKWPTSDVLVLDQPGKLPDAAIRSVASQLRRGLGLLYVTTEQADVANFAALQEALGTDFQPPVNLDPASADRADRELRISRIQARELPFSALGANDASALKTVRIRGGLPTRLAESSSKEAILAELTDTSALMFLTNVGAGAIAVLNTDLANSNWAVHPTFLPVINETIRQLIEGNDSSEQTLVGETSVQLLDPSFSDVGELRAATVDGESPAEDSYGSWEFSASQGCVVWNWPAVAGTGIYSLASGRNVAMQIATAAPPIESDLAPLELETLKDLASDRKNMAIRSAADDFEKRDDAWSWLIVACTIGLICEVVALRTTKM